MPTTGQPIFSARSMTLTIFSPKTSPSEPPKTVKSCAKTQTWPAVDGAVAGDDAVAVRPALVQPERRRPVPRQLVHLDERVLVEQRVDPLAGGHLALGVLLLDRARRAGVDGLVVATVQVGEPAGGGVEVDVLGHLGAAGRGGLGCAGHPGSVARAARTTVSGEGVDQQHGYRPHADPAAGEPAGRRRRPGRRRRAATGHGHRRGAARVPHDPAGLARGGERAGPGAGLLGLRAAGRPRTRAARTAPCRTPARRA